jgi:hypothetical protein
VKVTDEQTRASDHDLTRDYTEWAGSELEGSAARMFIQWKGTDVCLDFWCPCGSGGHFDGYGAYSLRCPDCGRTFDLGQQVLVRETDRPFSSDPKDLT